MKRANPEANILHAGIATNDGFSKRYWNEIYSDPEIGRFFDIANVHDLMMSRDGLVGFAEDLMQTYDIRHKEIWVTEFMLYRDADEMDERNMEARVDGAFSAGASNLFLLLPGGDDKIGPDLARALEDIVAKHQNSR